jgi:hypothetical protein
MSTNYQRGPVIVTKYGGPRPDLWRFEITSTRDYAMQPGQVKDLTGLDLVQLRGCIDDALAGLIPRSTRRGQVSCHDIR